MCVKSDTPSLLSEPYSNFSQPAGGSPPQLCTTHCPIPTVKIWFWLLLLAYHWVRWCHCRRGRSRDHNSAELRKAVFASALSLAHFMYSLRLVGERNVKGSFSHFIVSYLYQRKSPPEIGIKDDLLIPYLRESRS